MRKTLGMIVLLLVLVLPVSVNAANEDVTEYIRDGYSEYFDVEYNEDYDIIVARADIDTNMNDKRGIEGFNENIASIIFSDEIDLIDGGTGIMFIGFAEDEDGVEKSHAVVFYTWNHIGYTKAIVPLVEKEFYNSGTYYLITDRFSQHYENYQEADPIRDKNFIEELVMSSIGMEKEDDLPEVEW